MDTNLELRDGTTDLTDDETLDSVKVGPMNNPLWLHISVPEVSASDSLDPRLNFCAADAPTTPVYGMDFPQITAAGFYSIPFYTKLTHLQVILATGGTDPDMGAVKCWIDNAHRAHSPIDS